MSGENQTCVGCHEHKNSSPIARLPASLALNGGPKKLEGFHSSPRGFSFSRVVQPILDRHGVPCHTGGNDTPYNLTGERVTMDGMKRHLTQFEDYETSDCGTSTLAPSTPPENERRRP